MNIYICKHSLRIYPWAYVFVYIYVQPVDVLQERERLQQTTPHCNTLYTYSRWMCCKRERDCNRLQQAATDCNRLQQTATHSVHTAGGCAAGYANMMCAIFTILYLYVCIYVDAGNTYIYILTYINIHIHMCMYDLLLNLDHQVMQMWFT